MGFLRWRSQSEPIGIRADELYRVIHEMLVEKVPSLVPTVTPYGVMLLLLPETALMLNLSGERWSLGIYDVSAWPRLALKRSVDTPHGAMDLGELVVSVLEQCHATYVKAVAHGNLPADEMEWFVVRQDEVSRALKIDP